MKVENSILGWLLGNRSGRETVQEPGEESFSKYKCILKAIPLSQGSDRASH
ncbi:hypothetical protein [Planktothricoides raciborskii]|uniref:Uncharacterized protein n=1 Tax=Planktothricoides raciborskii FACHB-1370 TaxID=2949576 RepID=A0ABR8EP32_9CYAN|nr:hypothetical protein [Planktothricoides raciborskii]MBD2547723.1 hypothetical protein [Planktothricoides raciborskii FACHB-1370]MBD2586159.1 hypothetical protein [Planktothricoides raciborskii FACHB-1261]